MAGNEIVGYILSCFCVFYGLLLGLIAVASYQNLAEVEDNVAREVASLDALNQNVRTYPPPHGQNLSWLLRDYCRYVFKYAWDDYAKGGYPDRASRCASLHSTSACSRSSRRPRRRRSCTRRRSGSSTISWSTTACGRTPSQLGSPW